SRRDWEPFQTWATALLLGVFYVLTEAVDMMAALIVVMFALCMVWGERRWPVAAQVAFGTTAAIFFSFDLLLEVRFPRGLFTDMYYG
ncbi:MAG: tripartite tricarboxylate transporter TctB family protein, partial [Alphaproteobacteria bacterium]